MPDTQVTVAAPILVYDGRLGELYRIFLVNLLLTIVTLGVWRFWAVTRMRRYLWSRTSSGGERFEYDGTGGQLFVGFLLAMAILFGLAIAAVGLSVVLRPVNQVLALAPIFVFEFAIFVLVLGAPFSAQRYRLGHTLWCGIRGGMQGSMVAYGLRSLLYVVLMLVSFYQFAPWAAMWLLERRINASFFGTLRFAARGQPGKLYLRFLATSVGVLLLGIVVFGTFYLLERPVFALLANAHGPEMTQMVIRRLTFSVAATYLVFGLGAALLSASYAAAFYRHITSRTTLADLRFGSAVAGLDVLKLLLGNVAILLFTLGFGAPIVVHRNARFFTTNLLATGFLDPAALRQSDRPVSRFGEGMFQALDAGVGGV